MAKNDLQAVAPAREKRVAREDVHGITARYEAWLATQLKVLPEDVAQKHVGMAHSPFEFLRATFYLWSVRVRELEARELAGPPVLGVGDLHIENFGTWRDAEGRLAWGINDFDEATDVPYTQDLVRLAVSSLIGGAQVQMRMSTARVCETILDGYRESLERKGLPFVLAEEQAWLTEVAKEKLKKPSRFWRKLEFAAPATGLPKEVKALLLAELPKAAEHVRFVHRAAGLGSLGRERYCALGTLVGGSVAREAKALAPSAWDWAHGRTSAKIRYGEVLAASKRSHDPFLHVCQTSGKDTWVVRRLSPDCTRIELADLPNKQDEETLLHAMGREVANVHMATPGTRRAVLAHLRASSRWMLDATDRLLDRTESDFRAYRKR